MRRRAGAASCARACAGAASSDANKKAFISCAIKERTTATLHRDGGVRVSHNDGSAEIRPGDGVSAAGDPGVTT